MQRSRYRTHWTISLCFYMRLNHLHQEHASKRCWRPLAQISCSLKESNLKTRSMSWITAVGTTTCCWLGCDAKRIWSEKAWSVNLSSHTFISSLGLCDSLHQVLSALPSPAWYYWYNRRILSFSPQPVRDRRPLLQSKLNLLQLVLVHQRHSLLVQ